MIFNSFLKIWKYTTGYIHSIFKSGTPEELDYPMFLENTFYFLSIIFYIML